MKKRFITIAFLLIATDQLAKYIVRQIGGFYICNKGIAWGIQLPNVLIYTLILSLLLTVFIYLYSNLKSKGENLNKVTTLKSKIFFIWHWDFRLWILLILSGGLSNLIDRLYFGCVIDFINLNFWPANLASQFVGLASWPIFNLADSYITIGVIILIIRLLSNPKEAICGA